MSDHRAASRLSVVVLALFVAGCGSAPSASPAGWPSNLASDWGSTTGIGSLPTGDHLVSQTAR